MQPAKVPTQQVRTTTIYTSGGSFLVMVCDTTGAGPTPFDS